jgi:hypothetical protein
MLMIVDAEGRPRCRSDPVQNNIMRTQSRGLPKIGNMIVCGEDGFGLGQLVPARKGCLTFCWKNSGGLVSISRSRAFRRMMGKPHFMTSSCLLGELEQYRTQYNIGSSLSSIFSRHQVHMEAVSLGELATPIYQGGPICVSRWKNSVFGFVY